MAPGENGFARASEYVTGVGSAANYWIGRRIGQALPACLMSSARSLSSRTNPSDSKAAPGRGVTLQSHQRPCIK